MPTSERGAGRQRAQISSGVSSEGPTWRSSQSGDPPSGTEQPGDVLGGGGGVEPLGGTDPLRDLHAAGAQPLDAGIVAPGPERR
jgi:hypothetical protein